LTANLSLSLSLSLFSLFTKERRSAIKDRRRKFRRHADTREQIINLTSKSQPPPDEKKKKKKKGKGIKKEKNPR